MPLTRIARMAGLALIALAAAGPWETRPAQAQPQPAAAKVVNKTFGKWMSVCVRQTDGDGKDCFAGQSVNVTKGNQTARLIEVQLKSIKDDGDSMSLIVNLPLGIYLPAAPKLRIDAGEEVPLQVLTCTQAGCAAAAKVSMKTVDAMRRGKELIVGFIPQGSDKTTLIKLPLDGFDQAMAASFAAR